MRKGLISIGLVMSALVLGFNLGRLTVNDKDQARRIKKLEELNERSEQRTEFWGLKADYWQSNFWNCYTNHNGPL